MLLQLEFNLPRAKAGVGNCEMLSVHVCVRACGVKACVHLSHFKSSFISILFSYEDIFTKFAENVYGYEDMSVKNYCAEKTTWPP